MDFSDVDNASGEVGGEVNEVESKDTDFGDGDGVNDFDDTYSEMNSGNETMEYNNDPEGDGTTSESRTDEFKTTNDAVDDELEDFDDSSDPAMDQEVQDSQETIDDAEQSSNMSTDESVDDALSDFDDAADGGEQAESSVDADVDNAEDLDLGADEETEESGLEEAGETVDPSETKSEETADATEAQSEGTTVGDAENAENADTENVETVNSATGDESVENSVEGTNSDAAEEEGQAEDSTEVNDNGNEYQDIQPEELQENAENASNQSSSDVNQTIEVNDGTNNNGEDTSDGDIPKPEGNEKTAMFENVSYHQGQNDFGARGTCGPTSIANSLNRVTGTADYTENAVLHNAMDNNLCSKSWDPNAMGGTTTDNVISIIDNVKSPDSNIHTEVYEYDRALSVNDLADKVDNPGTVAMVGVDSATLWDQRGDVVSSGLFQHTEAPSDHWITVDSPTRDSDGNVAGFNIIDSGGGVDYVDRDKFEAMYQGDASHTISDPTAIIISNQGEATNTYATSEGVERGANFKGSAVESDGGDQPSEVDGVKIFNTERTLSGAELSEEQKEVNQYFRGDQYSAKDSFESSIESDHKEQLVSANCLTTCELNANLDGALDSNAKYSAKMSDAQMMDIKELKELRENVPAVTEDTVMQKVISPDQFAEYTSVDSPKTQVTGCASRAVDVAPYTSNMEQAYETLRLDYNGTCFKEPAENGEDMYVMRFTSEYCPGNEEYPKMDASQPWNKPPCTGTGYTGSSEHLVPEYTYGLGQDITDGAIYKVDKDGNETMVAMWNHGRFEKVE